MKTQGDITSNVINTSAYNSSSKSSVLLYESNLKARNFKNRHTDAQGAATGIHMEDRSSNHSKGGGRSGDRGSQKSSRRLKVGSKLAGVAIQ